MPCIVCDGAKNIMFKNIKQTAQISSINALTFIHAVNTSAQDEGR